MENHFGQVKDGIIISPVEDYIDHIQVFRGNHPYPDLSSVTASFELLAFVRSIPPGETVIFCLSGGASSLLTIPPVGVEVEELTLLHKILLSSGASIEEMNVVRKHVCELKGGKLALELAHTKLITLIVSDVPNEDLSIVGSGPTIADTSTFEDAINILKQYSLWNKIPRSIRIHLIMGADGEIPENPKPGFYEHPNRKVILLNSASALAVRIKKKLEEQNLHVWMDESPYNADIQTVTKKICTKVITVLKGDKTLPKPAALIFYGESSVKVKGKGLGGRNQHLALNCALALEGQHSVSILSIGTDGIDGPTDAAGALVDSYTTLNARKKKLEPEKYLQEFDAYHFHEAMGTLIKTGPTGNNLMDLQVLIIE